MAVSNKKIVDFHLVNQSANSKDYLKFMMKLKRKDKENNKSYLMDNCQIHKSKELRKYYKDNKIHVFYNVSYHSEKNPIETVFSCLKNQINKSVNDTYNDILKIVNNFRLTFNPQKLTNIFNYSFGLYDQLN
jgi:transposase